MYAMRRANGDWFAFDDRGRWRVPLFSSSHDAMLARTRNAGMLLFQPAALDESAVADIMSDDEGGSVYFWLVDDDSANVKRGHTLEHARLVRIVRGGAEPARDDTLT